MSDDPRLAVLGTINRIRDQVGAPELPDMPAGVMRDPGECPIQRGLRILSQDPADIEVWKKNMVVPNDLVPLLQAVWGQTKVKRHRRYVGYSRVAMPAYFQAFIASFDAGAYEDIAVPFGTDLPFEEPVAEAPDFVPAEWAEELVPA